MTHTKNGKQAPFRVGQRVHHLSTSADRKIRTVTWVSKGATCRADQVITTDYDTANTVEASIYVEATSPLPCGAADPRFYLHHARQV